MLFFSLILLPSNLIPDIYIHNRIHILHQIDTFLSYIFSPLDY